MAQTGSFTLAAERLGTNKSSVGKAIQRLEKHLATLLFQRTTRAVHITEDGQIYLAAARAALEHLREAEQALAINRAEPVGRVRVDLPAGFGRVVLPTLGALRARYPKVIVELSLSDRRSDPVGDGWDLVVIDGFAAPLVASGRLVHVLPQADVAAPPVHALISMGRKMTAKTRVVLDHLVATLQR